MKESDIEYTDGDELTNSVKNNRKNHKAGIFIVLSLILALLMGSIGGVASGILLATDTGLRKSLGLEDLNINSTKTEKLVLEESSAITDSVKKVSPAVVSIYISKNVTNLFGQTFEEQGGGTGFIITNDGMIATNKHVASDVDASYTVFTADGKEYSAKVLDQDPSNDFAVLKIDATGLPTVELGDSDSLQAGQWVVAIGNALGEFSNSVTAGVVSGLNRNITAGGGGQTESLDNLIQTDAAINSGNSGGPLINLAGQVIGINTATATSGQSVGFAIPINVAKKAIQSIEKVGKIQRPMIGIRYVQITKEIAQANKLSVNHGAWVLRGTSRSDVAVIPGSPADKVGIVENDIITAIDGTDINENNSLQKILQKYDVGNEIELTIQRKGKEVKVKLTLAEMQ